MEAYSLDLRQRVVAAVDAGEDKAAVAQRFCVSRQWVNKLLRQRRDTRSIAPKAYSPGRKPKIQGDSEEALRQAVEKTADATLDELRQACGAPVSVTSVWRALRRLKITLKKSRSTPANGRRRRSRRSGPHGAKRRPTSLHGGWCSSTRAEPAPG